MKKEIEEWLKAINKDIVDIRSTMRERAENNYFSEDSIENMYDDIFDEQSNFNGEDSDRHNFDYGVLISQNAVIAKLEELLAIENDHNSKHLELASELAHNDIITHFADLYTEEELWIEIDGGTVYKEEVQDQFNERYDYYLTIIKKILR